VCTVGAGPNLDLTRVPAPRTAPRDGVPTVLFVGKQFERKGARSCSRRFVSCARGSPTRGWSSSGRRRRRPVVLASSGSANLDKNRPDQWARLVGAYQNADVFCLPSLFEPFGIVILEAMFFGLPCVGTAEWAIPEMIANGETGYTAPRDDVKALAERLIALLSDRAGAHRMGLAGRRRAEERFSWTTVAARMGERLQRCLPSPRR